MDKFTKILLGIIGVLLICSSLLLLKTCNQGDKVQEQANLINSLNDSVKISKNKEGLNVSTNSTVVTKDPNDFLKLKNQSEEIKSLQKEVETYKDKIKKGGNVTNFKSETAITSTTKTIIDTIFIDSTKQAVYSSSFDKEGWVVGNVIARPDSTTVNVKTKEEYTVVVGFEPQGFLGLGTPKPFSLVKNKNPYSVTPELKTYQVEIQRKKGKWILPTAVGVVVGTILGAIVIQK